VLSKGHSLNIEVLQGSVVTRLSCGRISTFLLSPTEKKIAKSTKYCQNYELNVESLSCSVVFPLPVLYMEFLCVVSGRVFVSTQNVDLYNT